MAKIQGWAKQPHRTKARECSLDSWGHSFAQLGGKPVDAHLTFKRKITDEHSEQLVVMIESDQEALDIIRAMHEFIERRGGYRDKAAKLTTPAAPRP